MRFLGRFYCFGLIGLNILTQDLVESEEGGDTFINKVRFPYSTYYDPFMGDSFVSSDKRIIDGTNYYFEKYTYLLENIITIAVKLTPSEIDADLAWNIEANYFLPQNVSEYSFPPIIPEESSERSLFDRTMLYKMIELKLDSYSEKYGGKNCFLRILCEMSRYSTKDTDVLGDVVHILLSPSSSIDKNLPPKYTSAENYGKAKKHCKKYSKKCPIDVLGFFTVLGEILDNKLLE